MTDTLFPLPPADVPRDDAAPVAAPRVQRPDRTQVECRPVDLESLLPADHRARIVWDFVQGLDLSGLYGEIRAVEGGAGRPAIDPVMLMARWLYATLDGVGSARALERVCEQHDAYRWIAGGVSVNYHTLAEFRVAHVGVLDTALTTSVATLMAEGLVELKRVAQDGIRGRAPAGAASFRRRERLEACLAEATAQVGALKQEVHDDPGATARRQAAARERAARERQQRVAKALAQVPEIEAKEARGREGPGPGLDHGCGRARDEDGGWGGSAGLQRGVRDGHGDAGHCGRGCHQCGERSGRAGADGGATRRAVRAGPRGAAGGRRFYINMTKPPFDDIRVRRALMHAIDRKAIKDTMYPGGLGRLAVSPVPRDYFGHTPVELPDYNPELARKLLAEAGHPNGFTIKNYFVSKSFFFPKVATLAQEQLRKVGIILELQLVDHATYHEHIRKNLNPFVFYGGTRLPDADPWLSLFFHSSEIPDPATGNKGSNFAHYRGIDDLLVQGRQERDLRKRAAIYHEAQRRIMRDAVCLPLSEVPGEWARNPKRVSTPFDPEYGEDSLHFSYNYPELLKLL